MSEPLFHKGQHVAVLAMDQDCVMTFPKTTVVAHLGGRHICNHCGTTHFYRVEASPLYFCEPMLREIDPDTEYNEPNSAVTLSPQAPDMAPSDAPIVAVCPN